MKYNKHSRRMFLQGSSTLLAIPFLESLMPSYAWAQATTPINRFISVVSDFDYGHPKHWFPSLAKPGRALNIPGHHELRYETLQTYLGDGRSSLSRILVPELNAYAGQMNIYRGLDHASWYGHGKGHSLGNYQGVSNNQLLAAMPKIKTIDQILAKHARFNPSKSDVLILGTGGLSDQYGSLSYGLDAGGNVVGKPLSANSIAAAYNLLFDNGAFPEAGGTPVTNPRKDVLSRVMEDYRRVMSSRQISSQDKVVLTNALDKISDLANGVTAEIAASCKHKGTLTTEDKSRSFSTTTMRNYANLITAAVLCDRTRSVVFNASIGEMYDLTPDPDEGFHNGHTHKPFDVVAGRVNHEYMGDIKAEVMRYLVATLMQNLSSAIDPANGKSILHNSLMLCTGEHSIVHGHRSMPVLLAGNAGGALKTGYYMDYSNYSLAPIGGEGGFDGDPASPIFSNIYPGIPYNRLFVSILQSFGLTPSEYENPSLNPEFKNRTDGLFGVHNNNIANVGGYGYITVPNPSTASVYSTHYIKPMQALNFTHFKDKLPLP